MKIFQLRGESGKRFGREFRAFDSYLESPHFRFASLGADRFDFTRFFDAPDAPEIDDMEVGERIEIFADSERVFVGTFLETQLTDSASRVQARTVLEGVWWWLEQTPLTSLKREGSADLERPELFIPQGSIEGQLVSLFSRAQFLGVPAALGTVHPAYDAPQLTIKNGSVADGLRQILERLPDCCVEWDYSGSGLPRLNVYRRGSMPVRELVRSQLPLVSSDLRPVREFEAEEVVVSYTRRNSNGVAVLQEDRAGIHSGVIPARQVIAISGSELSDFLPPDRLRHFTDTGTRSLGGVLRGFIEQGNNYTVGPASYSFNRAIDIGGESPPIGLVRLETQAPVVTRARGGSLPPAAWNYYTSIPDWVREQTGLRTIDVTITGELTYVYNPTRAFPAWVTRAAVTREINGWNRNFVSTQALANAARRRVIAVAVNVRAFATLYTPPAGGLREIPAFDYVQPPPGFAQSLRSAQAWLPYSGQLELIEQQPPINGWLAQKVNIKGSHPNYSSMGALPSDVSIDLDRGRVQLSLGVPRYQSARSLVDRVRQSGSDNVVRI